MQILGFFGILIIAAGVATALLLTAESEESSSDSVVNQPNSGVTYEAIEIPSVQNCGGEFVYGRDISEWGFEGDYKNNKLIDGEK